MKILLLGEYSNVHWTLAEGLRCLGHEVTVLSNGDFWKNYPRDINLERRAGKTGGLQYMAKLYTLLPRLRNYDIVQLINPMFLEIKAHRILPIYKYLRKHNRRVLLGAFGMDYYWVHTCCTKKPLRYSDFNIGNELRTTPDALKERADWLGTDKQRLNELMARDCDGIIAGLYEYWVCYQPVFPEKTVFIPYPIRLSNPLPLKNQEKTDKKLRLFIGINRDRSVYKGTDIMMQAAKAIEKRYADSVSLKIVENVPFVRYRQMMQQADALLDQLYSYTPAMNALEAMSHGIICIGGGEKENYEILQETELKPIINVEPTYESVYHELEQLIIHPERIPLLQQQSIAYIKRHHDYIKVAQQYEQLYLRISSL